MLATDSDADVEMEEATAETEDAVTDAPAGEDEATATDDAATANDAATESVGRREMREDEITTDDCDEKVVSSWGVLSLVNAITMLLVARWYGEVVLPGSPSQFAGFKLTCDAASLSWRRRWRSSASACASTCPWRRRPSTGTTRRNNWCSIPRGCTRRPTRGRMRGSATYAKSSTSAEDMKCFMRIEPIKKGETISDVVARTMDAETGLDDAIALVNCWDDNTALQNVTAEPERRNTMTKNS